MMSFGFYFEHMHEDLFIDSSASRPVPMPGDSFVVAGNRLFLVNYNLIK